MSITSSNALGRTIRLLGVSASVDLTQANTTFPIFTTGDVKNRAPEQRTFVAFVEIIYNGGSGPTPATLTLRIGSGSGVSGDWAGTFTANTYPNPTLRYATDQSDSYGNGLQFALRTVAAAASGTAVVKAYGWTE